MARDDFDGTLDYEEYNRLHPCQGDCVIRETTCRLDCIGRPRSLDTDPDPLDETDRDGGALEDANDDAMDKWAGHYDDLNGAPENDEDR